MEKPPITNCHTHIFTGYHVPPYLAKSFVPFPFYFLFHLNFLVRVFRFFGNVSNNIKYHPALKKWQSLKASIRLYSRYYNPVLSLIGLILVIQFVFIIFRFLVWLGISEQSLFYKISFICETWLTEHKLLITDIQGFWQASGLIFLMFFIPSSRNLLKFAFRSLMLIPRAFVGPLSAKMMARYWNIVNYANYIEQRRIFFKLASQSPKGTRFVVLPMDMAYMDAGKPPYNLDRQLEELANIKKRNPGTFFPFIFADPRRIKEQENFFKYSFSEGIVKLENCFIKRMIEEKGFSGIKIYPALGYYPFDEALLPLWKYAADKKIPITAHSSKGPIHYRGSKKKEWNRHPVFMQTMSKGKTEALSLPQSSNIDFTANYTHPLNYLCLLNESVLRKVVRSCKEEIRDMFGYTDNKTPLKYDLKHLKICFAHFAGEEEWKSYLEHDRDNYSGQIFSNPDTGIDFLHDKNGKPSVGKTEQVWKYADWFSIITSLMLQHPNVYADISYIVQAEEKITPLLKQLLAHKVFSKRILFGSDFYVVRNHKSDRQILADIQAALTENEFDTIARYNPQTFLNLKGELEIFNDRNYQHKKMQKLLFRRKKRTIKM
ncbi:MAG: amidohydrolase family protein [Saprospiraceae bacterium]|nr:amidohydrolase family protein [Saprospiraceae bacterium]